MTSHESYIANTPADLLSPWEGVPGWSIHRNLLDMLHVPWLGVAKDLSGTLLLLLGWLYMETWSPDLPDALWYIWSEMRDHMRQHGKRCDVHPFTLNTIGWATASDYPVLHSRIKAANTKAVTL